MNPKRPADLPKWENGYPIPSHIRRNSLLAPKRAERKTEAPKLVEKLLKRRTAEELARRCGVSPKHIREIADGKRNASDLVIRMLTGLQKEIPRKAPMKTPATKPQRKSAIGTRSKKRQAEDRKVNDLAEFHAIFAGTPCWITGEPGDQAHHVGGRNHRLRHHRTNLMWVSRKGHRKAEAMGVLEVFAIKRKMDSEGWNDEVARCIYAAKNGRKDWVAA